jgi:hypothetical protein
MNLIPARKPQTDVEQALISISLQRPLRMEKNLAGFVRTK